jgi:xanthine dehydrogenase accessory factor
VTDPIFQSLAAAAAANQSVALGIITGVKGSSPQKLGAKAIFYPDRKINGTLGGGCLEAEAQRLALNSLKTGKPETFELVLDHDFGWDDGLICGGKVLGVILPDAQKLGENFWSGLAARDAKKTWGVRTNFSIALIDRGMDGTFHESEKSITVERGTSPYAMLAAAAPHLAPPPLPNAEREKGSPRFVEAARLAGDWLYTETITPPCALWIAGSGHIAQAVAPLARQLDFAVSIFDDRPELANHEIFPRDAALHVGHWNDILNVPFADTPTFGLIVTRGHKHDALVLETWIHRPFQFLGMIGSSRKARTIAEYFVKNKIATAEEVARVACPVGIKIKSRSVMEIAVDIVAQYIDERAVAKSRGLS